MKNVFDVGQREVIFFIYVSKQTLTSKKRGEKKSQTSERCKIVKSETPSGVTDFTILHLSRR
jgi:hypothetical protein